jgi:type II secretory pathway component PulC
MGILARSALVSLAFAATSALAGCGGNAPSAAGPVAPAASAKVAARPAKVTSIKRSAVKAAVQDGLGRMLAKVEIGAEPYRKAGNFAGFIVEGFREPEFFSGVDFEPGDVVTQVNGKSIERPELAVAVFESLAKAKELRVAIERKGAARELVLPIVED